jgi:hypothetical protein
MPQPDLRREPRHKTPVPVALVKGRDLVETFTGDVSYRGIFLRTRTPPALRSLLRLRLRLPERTIEAHAMAIHARDGEDGGVGLLFWGLAGPDRAAWEAFIRDLKHRKRSETEHGRMRADAS